jgi:hypothetical protein
MFRGVSQDRKCIDHLNDLILSVRNSYIIHMFIIFQLYVYNFSAICL